MSYGPPPRTAYGDQDFIKEDSSPTQQPPLDRPASPKYTGNTYETSWQSPVSPNASPYVQPSPYGQIPTGQPTGQTMNQPIASNQLINATQSMTQEDIIFMKEWRRDSFIYKFLPLAICGNVGLYYWSKSKDLPIKPLRHGILTTTCYLASFAFSRADLRRRVQESNLNTPFMSALKKLSASSGGAYSEFQEGATFQQDPRVSWTTTGDGFSRQSYPPPEPASTYPSPYSQTSFAGQNNQPDNHGGTFDPNSSYNYPRLESDYGSSGASENAFRANTSYEELRARNRGLLPPKQM